MITGSFVIDLFHLSAVTVDEAAMTVTVEGGAYLENVDKVN
jgi:hypothetical protein